MSTRRSFLLGMRDMAPLFVGAVPFGLVVGVTIAETPVPNWAGWLSCVLIFGGAAQLAAITLLGSGAPAISALGAALVVNARHLMYSAALVPKFRDQPRWFRRLGPYLMIDQVFALGSVHEDDPPDWRAYYLGAGLLAWTLWQIVVLVGILVGAVIPDGLRLEMAIPIMFIGLFVPHLTTRPAVAAAVSGGLATAALASIPNRGGMLVGGLVGVAVGTALDLRRRRQTEAAA